MKIIPKRWVFVNSYTLVSDHGDVVSLEKEKPILRKQSTDRFGYKSIKICGKAKKQMVHRLVAIAFISNPDDKPEVNHKDSNPANNVWTNLEWVTELENVHHSKVEWFKSKI